MVSWEMLALMDLEAGVGTGQGRKCHHESKAFIAMLIRISKNTVHATSQTMEGLHKVLSS